MPAKPAGDSKQGLIIALVCFVVLSIILGVTTYMGYADQDKLNSAAKDAASKTAAAEKERKWWEFRALQTQAMAVGIAQKDEAQELAALSGSPPSGSGQTDFVNVLAGMTKTLTNEKGKLDTYDERVKLLSTQLASTQQQLAAAELNLKKTKERYDEQMASREVDLVTTQKLLQQALAANVKDKADVNKALEDNLAKFDELSRNYETRKKQYDNELANRDKVERRQRDDIRMLTEKTSKLQTQIDPPDFLKFDRPKGVIQYLDRRGDIAYVKITGASNIRPQQNLTFSIFSPGTPGQPNKDYKGSIEIIDTISAQLFKAKIIQVAHPNTNPLMVGDVLINPAWSPREQEHVAIAGKIDLTNDGRNNIDEFMTNLARMGVVVDAYLDEKDNTIKGPGMNLKTAYLITGDSAEFGGTTIGANKDADFKSAFNAKITDMENEAKRLGVTAVPYRRFVDLIGYKLPKGAGVARVFRHDTPPPVKATDAKDAKKDDSEK
jgi:hypothetical protein